MKQTSTQNVFLVYAAWLFSTVVNFFLFFQIREFYMLWFAHMNVDRFVAGFVDKLLLVFIGVLAMGVIVFTESRYRRSVPQTFLWTTGIQFALLGLMTFGRASMYNVDGFLPRDGWIDIILWLGIGAACIAGAKYRQSRSQSSSK